MGLEPPRKVCAKISGLHFCCAVKHVQLKNVTVDVMNIIVAITVGIKRTILKDKYTAPSPDPSQWEWRIPSPQTSLVGSAPSLQCLRHSTQKHFWLRACVVGIFCQISETTHTILSAVCRCFLAIFFLSYNSGHLPTFTVNMIAAKLRIDRLIIVNILITAHHRLTNIQDWAMTDEVRVMLVCSQRWIKNSIAFLLYCV